MATKAGSLARLAVRILKGEKPQDIPIVRDTNVYMFDWRALRRWDSKESDLPPGSTVLYRQRTAWETFEPYIASGVLILLAETLLIFGLLWQRDKRRRVEEALVERLTFETLLSDLSASFINFTDEQIGLSIENALGRISEVLRMERITLHELTQDRAELAVTFCWRSEGSLSVPSVIQVSRFPWWKARTLSGAVVCISDVNRLPDEASAEKDYLLSLGTASLATLPLNASGEIFGSISFASTKRHIVWTEDLVKRLKILAEIFSNALERKHISRDLAASLAGLKRSEAVLRENEAILRESEARFRLVADTAPVLIWMAGPDKLCTYFNQSWLDFTGRPFEAELGNGWADGVHPDDLQRCLDSYIQSFDRREQFAIEYRLRRHDEEYRWILDVGVPRFNADNSFAGYIGSCLDITERKLGEEALSSVSRRLIEAQEKERTRIARELHDDVNQAIAMLAIELQQLKQDQPESAVSVRQRMDELGRRITEIGNDVQGISHRLHSSKLEYVGLVAACKGFCKEFAEQQSVEIDSSYGNLPRNLPKEISLCVFRVLQEALQNGVKHSGVKYFQVELSGTSNEVYLTVSDMGAGFDTDAAMDGRGLGLISMRERVSLVGGTISIVSKPLGGTKISVRIPLAAGSDTVQMTLSMGGGENGTYADRAG